MSAKTEGISPNASRLLWAGFMAILAAGVGFAIRGGIFAAWGKEYSFTATQLGALGGAGFSGFCFGIILGGLVVDKIGYGKLVAVAFLGHILSAFITFAASTPDNAYNYLFWGMFIFAYANGTLEAVANPLVATLYPSNRTHYLNILHASWPAGMVIGAVATWIFGDGMHWGWKAQLAIYLVPTVLYAILFFGQSFPKSEAAAKGSSFVEMFKDVGILGSALACFFLAKFFASLPIIIATGHGDLIGNCIGGGVMVVAVVVSRFSIGSVLLLVLFITHALVGAVELGTDQWIQNITGNLFTPEQGKQLFIWTSLIMFSLRFCAHFIERTLKLSPVGILFVCAVIACIGLRLTSGITTMTMAFAALAVYAVGKTFFWPTMLAVVGDRFPQTGAVAMSIMGGLAMLSAGLVGGPGLGYLKDRYSGEELQARDAAIFEEYKASKPSTFLNIESTATFGLDGTKLAEAKEAKERTPAQQTVVTADQAGDRHTLRSDSYIPATMAVIYLLLFLYFKTIGGYKPVHLAEELTGGTTGPMEG